MELSHNPKIAIIGLGYVGLPLAVEFGKSKQVVGFDINQARVNELNNANDSTLEVSSDELNASKHLSFSTNIEDIRDADVYIVTVPTPIDQNNTPDLTPLEKASALISTVVAKNNIVIYESTVYPGCTEEVCIPIIEEHSGLVFNQDFYAGYSPERINPGDKNRRVTDILKVTSGSTPQVADFVDTLYGSIVHAGTHKASSIQVAEASKVIENVQRDVNIALINELALIFKAVGIDTQEVLEAAATKWNFINLRPGLVGGHCIGVDPYYLVHKAQTVGYFPEIIAASRRLNDGMGKNVADQVMRLMTSQRIHIVDAKILVLGLAFKENCPDLRNTRVTDIIEQLERCNAHIDVYDPWVDSETAKNDLKVSMVDTPKEGEYDAVVVAVAHNQFKEAGIKTIKSWCKPEHVIYDVKYLFPADSVTERL